jgi:hypothetical protein
MLGVMTNKVTAVNVVNGQVAVVNASDLVHPFFGEFLVEVPEGTKSFEPSLYKSKTKEEFLESQKTQKDATDKSKATADKKADSA